ncbi:MAG: hypothetical protein OSJ70_04860 [Bacilli bacterium]|nr:hypothetical protein [Bacilli bacterium]
MEENILGVKVKISKRNIKIRNSFEVKDEAKMKIILNIVRNRAKKKNITFKRTNESWLQEWKAHNLLYKLNLFRDKTTDTDLEEAESKFRLFCYKILGR